MTNYEYAKKACAAFGVDTEQALAIVKSADLGGVPVKL